jgi:hypothetical protein
VRKRATLTGDAAACSASTTARQREWHTFAGREGSFWPIFKELRESALAVKALQRKRQGRPSQSERLSALESRRAFFFFYRYARSRYPARAPAQVHTTLSLRLVMDSRPPTRTTSCGSSPL